MMHENFGSLPIAVSLVAIVLAVASAGSHFVYKHRMGVQNDREEREGDTAA
jgi:hypothetical protein